MEGQFLNRLMEEVGIEVQIYRPRNLDQDMDLALIVEDILRV